MGTVRVTSERTVAAPPATVYECIANMREHHHRFLPPAFGDFAVEAGGVGAGTVVRFSVTAGGRTREYEMHVSEPEPGRVLVETDARSSLVTSFTVDARGDGSHVRVETRWQGAGGIGGFFERTFAPKAMRAIYADELERLDAYARARAGTSPER
ncbi:MAG TPA: SRPBCC family protein [Acidimicrobiales bacterium]|nr:SRPBCC family protein [Acidimicrobiales bacterium]